MRYYDNVVELIGNTPLVRLRSVTEGISATVLAKVEELQPRWQRQGPDRAADGRGGGEVRPAPGWRHDRGADQRQHWRRIGPGGPVARLQVRLRLPGQGLRGQAERGLRLRRRGGGLPDCGGAGRPTLLLQRFGSAGREIPGPGSRISTPTRTTRSRTSSPPDRSCGSRPTAGSPTSSRASAPAAPSPASASS